MCLERGEYGVVVAKSPEEVVIGRRCLADALFGCVVDRGDEGMEEMRLDVGLGVEVAPVDVAQSPFYDLVGYGEALLCGGEAGIALLTIAEAVDYQSKGAPPCGAWPKKLCALFFCCFFLSGSFPFLPSVFP